MRFSSVTIFSTLTWWYFNWRWYHALPWEGWHHLSHQIRKHQGMFKTIVHFWHQLTQYIFHVLSVLKQLQSFIFPSSADHLFLYLVAVSPPIILLAINGLLPFNYPIFWLVTPLIVFHLVSFPYFTSLGPSIFTIPILSNILCGFFPCGLLTFLYIPIIWFPVKFYSCWYSV